MIQITEYTGQQNVAIIPNDKVLKDPCYQFMYDEGVTICTIQSWIAYQGK